MTDPLAHSGLVVVDKPADMTSHDVVSRLRRIFKTRKIGHAGTLDPMATGVLVAGVERGTKFLAHLIMATKAYEARIFLGARTTTDDREGEVLEHRSTEHLNDTMIREALSTFVGTILQKPAAVSAIKIDGKRAYERVRAGEEVDIPAREVTISSIDVSDIKRVDDGIEVHVQVSCSSGTYIRSLARDLGDVLGVGGHLSYLRRTEVGPFTLHDALSLEELEKEPHLSLNLDEALNRAYPTLWVTETEARDLSMGKRLPGKGIENIHAAVAPNGHCVALVKEHKGQLKTVFVARPSTL